MMVDEFDKICGKLACLVRLSNGMGTTPCSWDRLRLPTC